LGANLTGFDEQEFLSLAKEKEGFLFPDTYLIPQIASPSSVMAIFDRNFENKFTRDLEADAIKGGLTKDQVLIFASIVEREAGLDSDRPLIAGILIKRWRNQWPLQADATLQYALANRLMEVIEVGDFNDFDWWPPVGPKDKKIDSPYNTYENLGLPPAPICSPGLASIKAVIYPEASKYWFYLSDPSGQTHYAETNAEHNENIRKHL
jgi:UPF0755 protein